MVDGLFFFESNESIAVVTEVYALRELAHKFTLQV